MSFILLDICFKPVPDDSWCQRNYSYVWAVPPPKSKIEVNQSRQFVNFYHATRYADGWKDGWIQTELRSPDKVLAGGGGDNNSVTLLCPSSQVSMVRATEAFNIGGQLLVHILQTAIHSNTIRKASDLYTSGQHCMTFNRKFYFIHICFHKT